jgi:thiamine monophosphate synthase
MKSKRFSRTGASVHSASEAMEALELGASYVIADTFFRRIVNRRSAQGIVFLERSMRFG